MRLYTQEYGLTELRLYTTAFVLWIAAVLIILLFTVLHGYRRYFAFGALVTGFLTIAFLNILNPDALIVRTNVARMHAGEEFDAAYLASLSADAVPSLLASLPEISEADRSIVQSKLDGRWSSPEAD